MPAPRPRPAPSTRAPAAAIAAALVLWALSEPLLLDVPGVTLPAALAVALGLTAPLLVLRRVPLLAAAVVGAVYLLQFALRAHPVGGVAPELALAFALFGATAFRAPGARWPWAGAAVAAAVPAAFGLLALLGVPRFAGAPPAFLLYFGAVVVAGAAPGIALRDRRGQVRGLRREVDVLEARVAEHVDDAVEAERDALDRSLARVVTGLVGEVGVLASEARRAVPAAPAAPATSGTTIAPAVPATGPGRPDLTAVGRRIAALCASATGELRGMLGTLHAAPEEAAVAAPAPHAPIGEAPARAGWSWERAADLLGRLAPWLLLAAFGIADQLQLPDLPRTAATWGSPFTVDAPVAAQPAGFVLAVLLPLPLVWRREAPLAAIGATMALLVLATLNGSLSSFSVAQTFAGATAAFVGGGWTRGRREAALGLALALAGTGASWALEDATFTVLQYAYMTAALCATWAVGRAVAAEVREAAALRHEAARLERRRRELTEVAIAAERRRVARELHDVVGHGLSLMAVQAGVVQAVGPTDPVRAEQALVHVEEAAERTQAELQALRLLLADPVLTDPGRWTSASVRHLVDDAQAAGQPVRARLDPRLDRVPTRTAAAAVRIVQEALTNARKHAAGAPTTVELAVRDDAVEVVVRNDARSGTEAAPAAGGGHGLPGMAERAADLGGSLAAGPAPGGAWAVRATLPV